MGQNGKAGSLAVGRACAGGAHQGISDTTCAVCRDQSLDWKAIRRSLPKARSADAVAVEGPLPVQNLIHDVPSTSFLRMASSERHDSASSSIESRRLPVPASPRTPKVPVLGKMGTGGSLPVYSYNAPAPEPSCPVRPDPEG